MNTPIFNTERRIRLGIWGLGRGMSFFNTCRSVHLDVVAGCDFNAHLRSNFASHNPGAFVTPSLIAMSDGGVVRNLIGATTDDGCAQRLWGTRGAADITHGLWLRFGGGGACPKTRVHPDLDDLDRLARESGHGGGDFWVLYYFAREILSGEKGPFDIYAAADLTLPGILACRSSFEDGTPQDVPDFRRTEERERYRNDAWHQPRYDVRAVFPADADPAVISDFSDIANQMCLYSEWVRAFQDWNAVAPQIEDKTFLQDRIAEPLLSDFDNVLLQYRRARRIADACPGSDGARVLSELLDVGDETAVNDGSLRAVLEATTEALRRARGQAHTLLTPYTVSALQEKTAPFDEMPYPGDALAFGPPDFPPCTCLDLRRHDGERDGALYIRTVFRAAEGGRGTLKVNSSSAFKLWVNRQFVVCAGSPAADGYAVDWQAGDNIVMLAFDTAHGITRVRIGELWCNLRLTAVEPRRTTNEACFV